MDHIGNACLGMKVVMAGDQICLLVLISHHGNVPREVEGNRNVYMSYGCDDEEGSEGEVKVAGGCRET